MGYFGEHRQLEVKHQVIVDDDLFYSNHERENFPLAVRDFKQERLMPSTLPCSHPVYVCILRLK